ncbi:MAG: carbonic anhydrase [Chlamydiales bacterium]
MRFLIIWISMALPLCGMTPDAAFKELLDGNARFQADKGACIDQDRAARERLAHGQKPFAIIVCCSDSRTAPEIVFDQGLGKLFVIRVAGNVIGETELESIRYAATQLGAPLILVMGHEYCGAVTAVATGQADTMPAIAKLIEPAVQETSTFLAAIKQNALNMKYFLEKRETISPLIEKGQLKVEAAYYHFISGEVEILVEKK